ncbi:hypothetical protein J3P80_20750 [Pseudomonas sp. D2-30]|uniref:hypothetical protein n=1 Tax=unclassified Pseudomonas TaxID=196821 RepID=UPI003B67A275
MNLPLFGVSDAKSLFQSIGSNKKPPVMVMTEAACKALSLYQVTKLAFLLRD